LGRLNKGKAALGYGNTVSRVCENTFLCFYGSGRGRFRVVATERGNIDGTHTSISSDTFSENWSLDGLGNWTEFQVNENGIGALEIDQDRTHNSATEVTAINASSADLGHSPSGVMNKTPQPDWTGNYTLKYDAWNRLVQVSSTEVLGSYEYDGLNRRIVKVDTAGSNNDTYHYYYSFDWQVLETRLGASSNPLAQYVWHPQYVDALAVRVYDADANGSGLAEQYYLQDANMNVVAVLGSTGTVLERYQYSTYGDVTYLDASFAPISSSTIANPYTYTGRRLDSETGLYQYRNRYYHAQIGRFVSRDPIAYAGSQWNLYEYVGSSPVAYLDPFGNVRIFGQEFVWPWSERASWNIGDNVAAYGNALGVAASGTATGAVSGATTGAGVGGTVGATAGFFGGAGVGAGPGFVAGATTGGTAGGIGGAISGFVSAAFSEDASDAAFNGAVSGAVSGGLGGLGGGLGAGLGAGGTRPLTHYTSAKCAQSIRGGLGGQGQLGSNASSNLFATTGSAAATTLKDTSAAIPISGVAANNFGTTYPIGFMTGFQNAAGHMVGPQGIINLTTGEVVAGGGLNTAAAGWYGVDLGTHIIVGAGLSDTE
jgi:RHS repeat-associated protein